MDDATFFATLAELEAWLEANHAQTAELWVGYYKKKSGRPGITYPESVDAALMFGWIDGIRKSIDGDRYKIRFTPRKPGSIWSEVNTRRMMELIEQEKVRPAGLAAFKRRDPKQTKLYSYEERNRPMAEEYERLLRENSPAWEFYQAQPESYRRAANWWVMSAKREETRLKRLATLIDDSANRRKIALYRRE